MSSPARRRIVQLFILLLLLLLLLVTLSLSSLSSSSSFFVRAQIFKQLCEPTVLTAGNRYTFNSAATENCQNLVISGTAVDIQFDDISDSKIVIENLGLTAPSATKEFAATFSSAIRDSDITFDKVTRELGAGGQETTTAQEHALFAFRSAATLVRSNITVKNCKVTGSLSSAAILKLRLLQIEGLILQPGHIVLEGNKMEISSLTSSATAGIDFGLFCFKSSVLNVNSSFRVENNQVSSGQISNVENTPNIYVIYCMLLVSGVADGNNNNNGGGGGGTGGNSSVFNFSSNTISNLQVTGKSSVVINLALFGGVSESVKLFDAFEASGNSLQTVSLKGDSQTVTSGGGMSVSVASFAGPVSISSSGGVTFRNNKVDNVIVSECRAPLKFIAFLFEKSLTCSNFTLDGFEVTKTGGGALTLDSITNTVDFALFSHTQTSSILTLTGEKGFAFFRVTNVQLNSLTLTSDSDTDSSLVRLRDISISGKGGATGGGGNNNENVNLNLISITNVFVEIFKQTSGLNGDSSCTLGILSLLNDLTLTVAGGGGAVNFEISGNEIRAAEADSVYKVTDTSFLGGPVTCSIFNALKRVYGVKSLTVKGNKISLFSVAADEEIDIVIVNFLDSLIGNAFVLPTFSSSSSSSSSSSYTAVSVFDGELFPPDSFLNVSQNIIERCKLRGKDDTTIALVHFSLSIGFTISSLNRIETSHNVIRDIDHSATLKSSSNGGDGETAIRFLGTESAVITLTGSSNSSIVVRNCTLRNVTVDSPRDFKFFGASFVRGVFSATQILFSDLVLDQLGARAKRTVAVVVGFYVASYNIHMSKNHAETCLTLIQASRLSVSRFWARARTGGFEFSAVSITNSDVRDACRLVLSDVLLDCPATSSTFPTFDDPDSLDGPTAGGAATRSPVSPLSVLAFEGAAMKIIQSTESLVTSIFVDNVSIRGGYKAGRVLRLRIVHFANSNDQMHFAGGASVSASLLALNPPSFSVTNCLIEPSYARATNSRLDVEIVMLSVKAFWSSSPETAFVFNVSNNVIGASKQFFPPPSSSTSPPSTNNNNNNNNNNKKEEKDFFFVYNQVGAVNAKAALIVVLNVWIITQITNVKHLLLLNNSMSDGVTVRTEGGTSRNVISFFFADVSQTTSPTISFTSPTPSPSKNNNKKEKTSIIFRNNNASDFVVFSSVGIYFQLLMCLKDISGLSMFLVDNSTAQRAQLHRSLASPRRVDIILAVFSMTRFMGAGIEHPRLSMTGQDKEYASSDDEDNNALIRVSGCSVTTAGIATAFNGITASHVASFVFLNDVRRIEVTDSFVDVKFVSGFQVGIASTPDDSQRAEHCGLCIFDIPNCCNGQKSKTAPFLSILLQRVKLLVDQETVKVAGSSSDFYIYLKKVTVSVLY